MTARSTRFRSLACLLALVLPALALAAPKGPREHPRGAFGQDESGRLFVGGLSRQGGRRQQVGMDRFYPHA